MKWATLEDVSTVVSKGTTPTTLGSSFVPDGIPFLRAEDVLGTAINPKAAAFCISEETDRLLSRSRLQPGDLLITIAGTLGRVGFVPMDAPPLNCNQAVAFVRLKPQAIDLHYACFACQAQMADLLTLRKIGTIGNLNLEQVRQFRIPLPPLSEQKRIATVLSRAESLRGIRRSALELTDTFLPAAFLELFGSARESRWDRSTLGELALDFSYGTSTKCSDDSALQAVLRIPNVIRGAIDTTGLKFGELSPSERNKLRLEQGDLIFVRTNGNPDYVGRCAVFDLETELYFASYLIRARIDEKLIAPTFLAAYLRMPDGRKSMQPSIRTTAGQYNVSIEGLRDVHVIVPPLPLQQEFVALIQRVARLRAMQREALRQAEHLFAALLARAFSG